MRLDSYHPAIGLLFFAVVIWCAAAFDQPVFLAIGWLCAFAYSVKLRGWKTLVLNVALVVFAAAFAVFYAGFNHFGVTVLGENFIGNQMTLESYIFGMVIGVKIATVVMWVECLLAIFTADMVVYLLGRVSPRLSLFVAIALRMAPRIGLKAKAVNGAQAGIGRAVSQGGAFRRIRNGVRVFSITLSWLMESLVQASVSMRSRGSALRGRSAYSLYRFDARDRATVIFLFCMLGIIIAAVLFDQANILYDPAVIMNRVTPLSCVFYAAYAAFCLAPLALQCAGEATFKRLMKSVSESGATAGTVTGTQAAASAKAAGGAVKAVAHAA